MDREDMDRLRELQQAERRRRNAASGIPTNPPDLPEIIEREQYEREQKSFSSIREAAASERDAEFRAAQQEYADEWSSQTQLDSHGRAPDPDAMQSIAHQLEQRRATRRAAAEQKYNTTITHYCTPYRACLLYTSDAADE